MEDVCPERVVHLDLRQREPEIEVAGIVGHKTNGPRQTVLKVAILRAPRQREAAARVSATDRAAMEDRGDVPWPGPRLPPQIDFCGTVLHHTPIISQRPAALSLGRHGARGENRSQLGSVDRHAGDRFEDRLGLAVLEWRRHRARRG